MEADVGLVVLAIISLIAALVVSWKYRIDEDVKMLKLNLFNIHKNVKRPGLYIAYVLWILAVVFLLLRVFTI